jgi:hypothetical protein
MSMAPRGPLPARVYWLRRGIVLAVALLLVLVVAKLLSGGSDGSEDGNAGGSMQLSGAGASTSSADPTGDAGATDAASESAQGKRAPLAEPSGPCDPEDVTVTAVGGQRPNDGKVEIVLAIGTSEDACTFSVSNDSIVVKIESGGHNYWSSQHCRVIPDQDVVARSAKPAKVQIVWDGHRYDDDCTSSIAWAMPGSYHVVAASLGGEPSDVQFELTRPPGVVITKTAKPKVTATPSASATKATASAPAEHTQAGATDQP